MDNPAAEWARCQSALDEAALQLNEVHRRATAESGSEQAAIFEAHLMMLNDPELLDGVKGMIEQSSVNAEAALHEVSESYATTLEDLDDEYLSARAVDVRDVSARVLRILLGISESPTAGLDKPSVITAQDLTPSDTVLLDKTCVLGFCTAQGGATSHTAILARGLGLPAVVGAGDGVTTLADGTPIILDGSQGEVTIQPNQKMLSRARERQAAAAALLGDARAKAHEPAVTPDGHRVEVVANIGGVDGAQRALSEGAEGVGLLRTEFLYLERSSLPDEDEQYEAYLAIARAFGELPVVLRTLDVGGDKELPYLDFGAPAEANPFLGVRAIRLCLAHPDLFKPQMRAALRAGANGNLKMMFPMVATAGEVRAARAVIEECRAELKAEKKPYARSMEIGIMVEIPAAAVAADQLAREVDFFSIGTNDLSQYTMAADRTNAQVAPLASAFQPAVLRLIQRVIDEAHRAGKWVGLCGELAGEPLGIPILLGLGLDEFSMNPPAIPLAKQIIRSVRLDEAREAALAALACESDVDIQRLVRERFPGVDFG